jgi:hypothetical protein
MALEGHILVNGDNCGKLKISNVPERKEVD